MTLYGPPTFRDILHSAIIGAGLGLVARSALDSRQLMKQAAQKRPQEDLATLRDLAEYASVSVDHELRLDDLADRIRHLEQTR